jgi:nitrite reductase/ring-hydroxylating ferredoxin subunit
MSSWALSLSNCQRTPTEHLVPNVRVDIEISTNLPQYNNLNFINGWVYLDGGYNGIIAYRVNNDEIKAYDRQAPYNVGDKCRVLVDTGATYCTDTCSGSQWLLLDGQVLNGPAAQPLRAYQTTFDGSVLIITN